MVLSKSRHDRQMGSYVDKSDTLGKGQTAVRTQVAEIGFTDGVDYDRIDITYPDGVTELVTYTLNSITQVQLEIKYIDSNKRDVSYVRKL